jgi:hypothetical protein
MIRQSDFPGWSKEQIDKFNSHPMISKSYDSFFEEARWTALNNVIIGEDENGEKIYWSLRFNAFMQTMILNTNSCNDAFFNKMIGFLDEYELAYKNYLNNEEQNKIKEDFV